jgi:hypothetical protein
MGDHAAGVGRERSQRKRGLGGPRLASAAGLVTSRRGGADAPKRARRLSPKETGARPRATKGSVRGRGWQPTSINSNASAKSTPSRS